MYGGGVGTGERGSGAHGGPGRRADRGRGGRGRRAGREHWGRPGVWSANSRGAVGAGTVAGKAARIGPATVSAVLAAVYPERYPFLEDVVAVQVPELGPPAFTPRYYAAYTVVLRARAAELAARCPDSGWTPHAVDLALWATQQER